MLQSTRTSQATIGLTKSVFESLLPLFEKALTNVVNEKQSGAGHP